MGSRVNWGKSAESDRMAVVGTDGVQLGSLENGQKVGLSPLEVMALSVANASTMAVDTALKRSAMERASNLVMNPIGRGSLAPENA